MKRLLLSGLSAAFLLGVMGCGGGMDEGVPKDTKPDLPLDTVKANMGTTKVDLKKLPTGTESGDAAAKK